MVKDITQLRCQNCFGELDVKGQHSGIVRCEYCGTDNVLSQDIRKVRAQDTHSFLVSLKNALDKTLDYEGLSNLCLQMNAYPNVAYYHFTVEHLGGRSTTERVLNLVLWCKRHNTLQELVDTVLVLYPSIEL